MSKLKHKLPIYSVLEHMSIDEDTLKELVEITMAMDNEFKSVLESNKQLCAVNHELTKSVYDNFFQISLTESDFNTSDVDLEECEVSYENLHSGSMADSIRQKKLLASSAGSALNENLYKNKTEHYTRYTALFDKILANLKGVPTRVRLVKLQAGTSIAPHIDYDPSYAVRIILPIIASPECVNLFWAKNEIVSTAFVPGKAYFLNTGYKHAVMNFSKHDRYTFMISINGTEDIDHLIA